MDEFRDDKRMILAVAGALRNAMWSKNRKKNFDPRKIIHNFNRFNFF